VKANPDKPWDYGYLSQNPNITWDIVKANPEEPWNYKWLSCNRMTNRKPSEIVSKNRVHSRMRLLKSELCQKALEWYLRPENVQYYVEKYGWEEWDEYV
jgi:hypothetical protein